MATLKDILNAPLRATGVEIPEGSYPGVLLGFSDARRVPIAEKFRKANGPSDRLCFDANYVIRIKDGSCQLVSYLLPVPEGGATNKKSNLYKMLRALAAGRPGLMTDDGFASGVTLESFLGASATVSIARKGDWSNIEGISSPLDGAKYPTDEELKVLKSSAADSGDIPF